MSNQTHLKSIKNGRVFLFSKTLATRDDMIPCDAEGKIASGHVGDANSAEATMERRVTKFLGNTTNGVLYPYTKYLAERSDMVSIDTEEQWETMRKTGEAPEQVANAIKPAASETDQAPSLTRTNPGSESEKNPAPASAQGTGEYSLPVIEGMGAREAKTVLSQWAEEKFKVKLDRRPGLDEVIKACQELITKKVDKTG